MFDKNSAQCATSPSACTVSTLGKKSRVKSFYYQHSDREYGKEEIDPECRVKSVDKHVSYGHSLI